MNNIWSDVINYALGIVSGIISTIVYEKMCEKKKKREVKTIKNNLSSVNIFEEYARVKEVIPIVSFEDTSAIQIEPLFQSGIYILEANIDLANKPKTRDNRNFVMALLKYIPELNWKYYCESGYSFKFKIRGNIKGVQIEIKNNRMRKILDEYVSITRNFEENAFQLKGESSIWENIEEICFTVFSENKYIDADRGRFEIMDCRLEK